MKEVNALFCVMGLDISDLISFIEALDVRGTQELEIDQFMVGFMNLRGSAKNLDMATLVRHNSVLMDKIAQSLQRLEHKLSSATVRLSPGGRSRHTVAGDRGHVADNFTVSKTPVPLTTADLRMDHELFASVAVSSGPSTSLSTFRLSRRVPSTPGGSLPPCRRVHL